MLEDGFLSQVDVQSGSKVTIRLVPFFFEEEERDYVWRPIVEPDVLTALTAMLSPEPSPEPSPVPVTRTRHPYPHPYPSP